MVFLMDNNTTFRNCPKSLQCIWVSGVTLLAIGGISLVILFMNNSSHEHSQLTESHNISSQITVIAIKEPVIGEENIMFLETSCAFEKPDYESAEGQPLDPHQACALESAALANPQASIYLLYTCNSSLHLAPAYVQQLYTYSNIHMWQVNIGKWLMNTTLERWFQTGNLSLSRYLSSHTRDVLRTFIMWKYGGTYMDLDVVVIRSLSGLSNFVGAENKVLLGSAVLNFATNGIGHEIAEACLEELNTEPWGSGWTHNGPHLITRVLNRTCRWVQLTSEMTPERCQGFTVYPPAIFYPIPSIKWHSYFEEMSYSKTMAQLNESMAIHVWNSMKNKEKIKVGSKQPYGLIAQKYCPKVYANCGDSF